jgi:hypothetical protein
MQVLLSSGSEPQTAIVRRSFISSSAAHHGSGFIEGSESWALVYDARYGYEDK